MPRLASPAFAIAPPRYALMHNQMDWQSAALIEAFARRGAQLVPVRLSACGFDGASPAGLRIQGFSKLPEGVLVRLIAGGAFEAVTMRLGVLHALERLGVPVLNNAKTIEKCTDKSMTSFLLAQAGIATPLTFALPSLKAAKALVRKYAGDVPLVLKPLFGSQGRGLKLIRKESDLPASELLGGVYYLQQFVGAFGDKFRDIRVMVSKGRAVAAMERASTHWITNIKQGGEPIWLTPEPEILKLALAATEALGADFAGVDIVRDVHGAPFVLEVNAMPGWAGLQSVTSFSIADQFANDFLTEVAAGSDGGLHFALAAN